MENAQDSQDPEFYAGEGLRPLYFNPNGKSEFLVNSKKIMETIKISSLSPVFVS